MMDEHRLGRMTKGSQKYHKAKLKTLNDNFHQLLTTEPDTLHNDMVDFFLSHTLDITMFTAGSTAFMMACHKRFYCQISTFDSTKLYRRVQIQPPKFQPELPQIYILRTQYLIESDKTRETSQPHHYHGLRSNARAICGHDKQFCPHCGETFSYYAASHACSDIDQKLCKLCHRFKVPLIRWERYSEESQVLFCVEEPSSYAETTCENCKRQCPDMSCYNFHSRSCNIVRCQKCHRTIRQQGKYVGNVLEEKFNGCHESCQETWCQRCGDYVLGFQDPENIQHTCFVKALERTPRHPAGIACLDLECSPDMEVNAGVIVYQKIPWSPDGGVMMKTFFDIKCHYEPQSWPPPPENIPSTPPETDEGESSTGVGNTHEQMRPTQRQPVKDDLNIGFPAEDLSGLKHLTTWFPWSKLIPGKPVSGKAKPGCQGVYIDPKAVSSCCQLSEISLIFVDIT
jgi:hypothetical protein